jgi:type II secretory pathway pseudopilin PulG
MKLTRKTGVIVGVSSIAVAVAYLTLQPVYQKMRREAQAKAMLKQAYEIHQALYAYANGNDGVFPIGEEWSNNAYRKLFIAGVLDDERIFFVPGSATCSGSKPDGELGTSANGYASAVAAGENHWAYATGLSSDRDDSSQPLVVDPGELRLQIRLGGSMKVGTDAPLPLPTAAHLLPPQPIPLGAPPPDPAGQL